MNIHMADPDQISVWESEFGQEGLVIIPDVELPGTFEPAVTDLVFMQNGDRIEVYIGAWNRYRGVDPQWIEIMRHPRVPGDTRLVGSGPASFIAALIWTRVLLRSAAGAEGQLPQGTNAAGDANDTLEAWADASAPASGVQQQPPPPGMLVRDLVTEVGATATPIEGRDDEVVGLVTCLLRETKPGAVLLGLAGCGKTTIVRELARRIAAAEVPNELRQTPLYEVELGDLAGNDRHLGRMLEQVRQLIDLPGRPIIFVDELHQLAQWELRPLQDLMKPSMATGQLRLIGASTPVEWRQIQDQAFRRRLTEIVVRQPSPQETLHMLLPRLEALSAHHRLVINEDHLRLAIRMAARYLPHRTFPDKALDLLDQAAAMQRVSSVRQQHLLEVAPYEANG